jgi:GNAT superfamily N-acetyltransferase
VADLIESSFSATLDPNGRRYLRQMRAMAAKKGLGRWSAMASNASIFSTTGFVWEEAGKVVGNLSLVPFLSKGRRIDLVANVAVYPEYRRRGIARALTLAGLEKSRGRHASATWLQVRQDNQAAIGLYTGLGFKARACRTTWIATPGALRVDFEPDRWVTLRKSRHWSRQKAWLDQNYPPALRWHFPLKMMAMRPGLGGALYRLFEEVEINHWAVARERHLLGVLSWQRARGYADHLWLAAPGTYEDQVLRTLIPHIRRDRNLRRPLSLDYEAGRAEETLRQAGFEPKATLVWMEVQHQRP